MRKIAFLIESLRCGGAQKQLVTLAKTLKKEGFDITILYFYPDGFFEPELKDSGIRLICLEKQGRWDLFSFFWRLVHHLKLIKPDVLHGYLETANLLTIFLKPFLRTPQIVWGVRVSNMDLSHSDWLSRILFPWECFLSRFADLIIVNSKAGHSYYLEHVFPAHKMIVIPNGIDTERFNLDIEARQKVRAEWCLSENTILIGLVGRLAPMKDHPTFLKAAALLCKDRQDVSFVCVGSGLEDYTQELYQLTVQLDISEKVIWAGRRVDMSAVYNALDILCSSSAYGEGFANVIGEAMACGVPCVVTDVGDSAWIVENVGIVVPPGNSEALVAGWRSLIKEQQYKNPVLKLKNRSRILLEFNCNKLIQNVVSSLEQSPSNFSLDR
ncbi:glycosyltransferase [Microcoleus sp. FACHB-SPT15]|uniref:glycosyltransferase n=1 Tax=Microcoleus sp. FACHB-SPT15 TaxID=2692830 RepID=UPI00177E9EB4|nr:glycosyltransferase [Microcoleus sp. FACHB-SPT15]MBD1806555.1 glycosyltransferase [Microcoleus sp. FACHB-SPT15]